MCIVALPLVIIALLGIILVNKNLDPIYLRRTKPAIHRAKLACGITIIVSFFAFVTACNVHKPVQDQSSFSTPNVSSSIQVPPAHVEKTTDMQTYNKVCSDFLNQGIKLVESSSSTASIRYYFGCNADDSLILSAWVDSNTHYVKAYQLIVFNSTLPEIKVLIKDVLPDWNDGPSWIDHNLNTHNLASTTYKAAKIVFCVNMKTSHETGYFFAIYPHGDSNI